jgi:hypothetical protein
MLALHRSRLVVAWRIIIAAAAAAAAARLVLLPGRCHALHRRCSSCCWDVASHAQQLDSGALDSHHHHVAHIQHHQQLGVLVLHIHWLLLLLVACLHCSTSAAALLVCCRAGCARSYSGCGRDGAAGEH